MVVDLDTLYNIDDTEALTRLKAAMQIIKDSKSQATPQPPSHVHQAQQGALTPSPAPIPPTHAAAPPPPAPTPFHLLHLPAPNPNPVLALGPAPPPVPSGPPAPIRNFPAAPIESPVPQSIKKPLPKIPDKPKSPRQTLIDESAPHVESVFEKLAEISPRTATTHHNEAPHIAELKKELHLESLAQENALLHPVPHHQPSSRDLEEDHSTPPPPQSEHKRLNATLFPTPFTAAPAPIPPKPPIVRRSSTPSEVLIPASAHHVEQVKVDPHPHEFMKPIPVIVHGPSPQDSVNDTAFAAPKSEPNLFHGARTKDLPRAKSDEDPRTLVSPRGSAPPRPKTFAFLRIFSARSSSQCIVF